MDSPRSAPILPEDPQVPDVVGLSSMGLSSGLFKSLYYKHWCCLQYQLYTRDIGYKLVMLECHPTSTYRARCF